MKTKKAKVLHTCKITPLNQQAKTLKLADMKGLVLMSQYVSNIQVYRKSDNKYFSVANPSRREAVAEENAKPVIFDIATNPHEGTDAKMVRDGYLNLIEEKILNDLEVYRVLLDSMNITGNKITLDDIANKIKENPQGQNALAKALGDLRPMFEDIGNYMGCYEEASQALCGIMGWSRC